jgi:acyl-CoA synthetase (NDP forming)
MGVPPFDFILDLAKKYPEKPVLVSFSAEKDCMQECKAFLEPRGVPTFPEVEQPFQALSILVRCARAMQRA